MGKIIKGNETMTSKERVRAVFHREKPDRVPIDYMANPGIDRRLKEYLGLKADDWNGLYEMLGMDFRSVGAYYAGPVLHTSDRTDRDVNSMYGWITRWVENKSGGYSDFCDFPLKNAGVEEVAAYALPDPDNFNYDCLEGMIEANADKAIFLGNAGLACVINNAGFFRGMEQTFVDLITEDEAGMLLIDRFIGQQLAVLEREIDAIDKIAKRKSLKVSDLVEFVWMGEDLGTQNTPLISMELFKSQILPRQKPFFDLCRQYDLPSLLHTCGSSSWTYEEYIKAGLTGVDTLQPEAKNMDPGYLKKTFGGRLVFHGCISTGGPLAFGTADDTVDYCKNTLDIMMPGYEYCFSPTHSLQDNTPVENIVAAYNTAHRYGRY
ncbi:MAG: uroporphyrinogen decarboxylase family protein [Saccharofermentanales bacterium]